jgi:plasmid maintenance system antidote protein VapI
MKLRSSNKSKHSMKHASMPDPIAVAILAEIERQDRTKSSVAEAAGVHRALLSEWLAGKRSTTTETASKVMAELGLEVRPK